MRYLEVFLNDNISVIGKNGLVIRQDTQEGIILPVKALGYKSIKPEPRENCKTEIDTIGWGCQEKGKETPSVGNDDDRKQGGASRIDRGIGGESRNDRGAVF